MADAFSRAKLSPTERNFRSRITQLASGTWFLRGTLSERHSKCGKPSCHCATGELHHSLYLVQSQQGKVRQLCVPKDWQDRVRHAVGDFRALQQLIEEVSELEWKRLQDRKR